MAERIDLRKTYKGLYAAKADWKWTLLIVQPDFAARPAGAAPDHHQAAGDALGDT